MSKQSSDLWSKVDAVVKHHAPRVAEGAGFTLVDYAKRYKISEPAARYQLKHLIAVGKVAALGKRGKVMIYDVC